MVINIFALITIITLFTSSCVFSLPVCTIPQSGPQAQLPILQTDSQGRSLVIWSDGLTQEIKFSYKPKEDLFTKAYVLDIYSSQINYIVTTSIAFDSYGNAMAVWQHDLSTLAYAYRPSGDFSTFGPMQTLHIAEPVIGTLVVQTSPTDEFVVIFSTSSLGAIQNNVTSSLRWAKSQGFNQALTSDLVISTGMLSCVTNAKYGYHGTAAMPLSFDFSPAGDILVTWRAIQNSDTPDVFYAFKHNGSENFSSYQKISTQYNYIGNSNVHTFYIEDYGWFVTWEGFNETSPTTYGIYGCLINNNGASVSNLLLNNLGFTQDGLPQVGKPQSTKIDPKTIVFMWSDVNPGTNYKRTLSYTYTISNPLLQFTDSAINIVGLSQTLYSLALSSFCASAFSIPGVVLSQNPNQILSTYWAFQPSNSSTFFLKDDLPFSYFKTALQKSSFINGLSTASPSALLLWSLPGVSSIYYSITSYDSSKALSSAINSFTPSKYLKSTY